MRRFQAALQKQLTTQHEKVKLEMSELSEALKRKLNERESLGVELYGVQQELARFDHIPLEHCYILSVTTYLRLHVDCFGPRRNC